MVVPAMAPERPSEFSIADSRGRLVSGAGAGWADAGRDSATSPRNTTGHTAYRFIVALPPRAWPGTKRALRRGECRAVELRVLKSGKTRGGLGRRAPAGTARAAVAATMVIAAPGHDLGDVVAAVTAVRPGPAGGDDLGVRQASGHRVAQCAVGHGVAGTDDHRASPLGWFVTMTTIFIIRRRRRSALTAVKTTTGARRLPHPQRTSSPALHGEVGGSAKRTRRAWLPSVMEVNPPLHGAATDSHSPPPGQISPGRLGSDRAAGACAPPG